MTAPRAEARPPASDLLQLKDFMERAGVRPAYFILPVLLAAGVAFFEGLSIGLLIPLAKGIITRDFGFTKTIPVFGWLVSQLSRWTPISNAALFGMLLVLVFLSAVLKNVLQYGAFLSVIYQIRRFSSGMRKLIFDRYMSFGKLYFDQTNSGTLHAMLMTFTGAIANRLGDLQQLFTWLFMLLAYTVLMFAISWKLTLLVLLILPLLNYSMRWLITRIRASSKSHAAAQNEMSKRIQNILSCILLVKSYTMEEAEKERFARTSDLVRAFEFSIDKKQGIMAPTQEVLVLIMLLLFIAAAGLISARRGPGAISDFLVYFYLIKRSAIAFGVLNNLKSSLAAISGPIGEIRKLLDDDGKFFVADGAEVFPALARGLEFRSLDYAFPNGSPVLRSVGFSVDKGEMTAIVGPSGAGKTTLINLLMRFYDPPPASLFLDGSDIRGFTLASLRSHMALVSQDALLFNDSLRANICYGMREPVSEEKLAAVVAKARLGPLIEKLPAGLDTAVGDRGVQLSGGEKQRVSIARALLKGAEILILDEATSALDTKTEKLIQEAIDETISGKTAIVIAHRLSTIKKADKIVVLEEGRVVESGPLKELLEKKGRFHQYWEEQKFF